MFEATATVISEIFAQTLETMAFVCPLPPDGPAIPPADAVLVRVVFADDSFGALELVAGKAFGLLLASNLLGVSPDTPEAGRRAIDCLKELMNIACGNVLADLLGEGAKTIELGIPLVLPFNAAGAWDEFVRSPDACVFDAEGHAIALRMKVGS